MFPRSKFNINIYSLFGLAAYFHYRANFLGIVMYFVEFTIISVVTISIAWKKIENVKS